MDAPLLNYGDGPQAIYEELKQRIISGQLVAGSELKIMPLAGELGVSIVPVREAIRILAAENLVTLRPRRSPIIAKLDRRELIEINRIRSALEPLVLEDAISRHTAETLSTCEELLERDRQCTDIWENVELNKQFHLALLSPSALKRMIAIISAQYVGISRLTHYLVMNHPGLVDPHHDEHRAILDAVRAANEKLAVALMREHIDRATERTRGLLDEGEKSESE